MPESRLPFEIESLADHARRLWLEAQGEAIPARVELFVKLSLRSRIARDLTRCGVARDHSYESGIAMRLLQPGSARAEFAAASGMTSEVLRWTLHTAGGLGARVTAMAPRPSDVTESERWDLDAAAPLPDEEVLTAIVMSREELEWVEAGTTLEVLVGEGGWVAARRRNRVWALIRRDGATLKAQRGFAGLEGLVESGSADFSFGKESPSNDLKVLVLSPDAASSLVVALAGAFHAAEVNPAARVGPGWVVSDEPSHLGGLAGGSFDDAGFPAASRVLAADGVWKAGLSGPGTRVGARFASPQENP